MTLAIGKNTYFASNLTYRMYIRYKSATPFKIHGYHTSENYK
jgi:hypothetical protein